MFSPAVITLYIAVGEEVGLRPDGGSYQSPRRLAITTVEFHDIKLVQAKCENIGPFCDSKDHCMFKDWWSLQGITFKVQSYSDSKSIIY